MVFATNCNTYFFSFSIVCWEKICSPCIKISMIDIVCWICLDAAKQQDLYNQVNFCLKMESAFGSQSCLNLSEYDSVFVWLFKTAWFLEYRTVTTSWSSNSCIEHLTFSFLPAIWPFCGVASWWHWFFQWCLNSSFINCSNYSSNMIIVRYSCGVWFLFSITILEESRWFMMVRLVL